MVGKIVNKYLMPPITQISTRGVITGRTMDIITNERPMTQIGTNIEI